MSQLGDDESAFRDWLGVLGRQKWIVLLAVIVVPLVAIVVSRAQQRLYEASATVLVNQQSPTAAALNLNTGVASPPDRFVATQAALARVGSVAGMAVKAAHVPHRTAAALLANSSVSANPSADLLKFSVTDSNPGVARRLATAYARQFTVYRHRLDTAALSFAIADVHRKLDSLVASGEGTSPLFRSLSATYRDLQAAQTLQAADSSAVLVVRPAERLSAQPKTSRNVILAVLVGLALGIGLAFLREALDTRVRSADELRERLGLPLLGQVPKPDRRLEQAQRLGTLSADELRARLGLPLLGQVPKPDRRVGHVQRLAALAEPPRTGAEDFEILKTNLDMSQVQGDVGSIVITSTTQGEGKSVTAANLAVTLARSGRHVILVDLDLRHPGIDRFFGLSDRPGLTSAEEGDVKLVDALSVVYVHPDRSETNAGLLEVMTVGTPPSDPDDFLSSSFVSGALATLAARCDVLLIDAPPYWRWATR